MTVRQIIGIVLIVIGIASFGWGGIFWNDRDTLVDAGPFKITKTDREGVAVPRTLGVLSLVSGIVLLLVPERRRV